MNGIVYRAFQLFTSVSLLGMLVYFARPQQHSNVHQLKLPEQVEESKLRRDLSQGRIVGGHATVKGAYPWIVSLRNADETGWSWATCGGSLITPTIVLTGELFTHTVTYPHTLCSFSTLSLLDRHVFYLLQRLIV